MQLKTEQKQKKKRVYSEDDLHFMYMKALGTPHPVGTKINDNGHYRVITDYGFDLSVGLIAHTDTGIDLNDYKHLSSPGRKRRINQFWHNLLG